MSNEQQGSQWQQDGLETRLRTVERTANSAAATATTRTFRVNVNVAAGTVTMVNLGSMSL